MSHNVGHPNKVLGWIASSCPGHFLLEMRKSAEPWWLFLHCWEWMCSAVKWLRGRRKEQKGEGHKANMAAKGVTGDDAQWLREKKYVSLVSSQNCLYNFFFPKSDRIKFIPSTSWTRFLMNLIWAEIWFWMWAVRRWIKASATLVNDEKWNTRCIYAGTQAQEYPSDSMAFVVTHYAPPCSTCSMLLHMKQVMC